MWVASYAKLFLVSRNLDNDEGERMFSSCQLSVKSSILLKQFRYIFQGIFKFQTKIMYTQKSSSFHETLIKMKE